MEGSYSTVWKPSRVEGVVQAHNLNVEGVVQAHNLNVKTPKQDALPRKMLETTIGFLCLYFHPNGKWLLTCEVCTTSTSGRRGNKLNGFKHFT